MTNVFLLQHNIPRGDHDNSKIIGIYSSRVLAEAAIDRLKGKPVFRDPKGTFTVGPYQIDLDYSADGFGLASD